MGHAIVMMLMPQLPVSVSHYGRMFDIPKRPDIRTIARTPFTRIKKQSNKPLVFNFLLL
jgi:hypothetical protein